MFKGADWAESTAAYLSGLIEARQPADLCWPLLVSVAAAERQQRSFGDQQHVSDMQVDVLLPLPLVVVQRAVLKALCAHPDVNMASEFLSKTLSTLG